VLAISAVVQRDQVVIAGALQAANLNPRGGVIRLRRVVNQQGYQVIGPRIAAFGLADGKARFLSKLFANDDDVNWQWLLGPVVTENQVITVVKQQLGAQRLLACITDANSGALLQELAVDQPAANQPAAANPAIVVGGGLALRLGAAGGNPQGFMSAGNAAVANGVLIIEGSAEIIVFDKSDTK
jgi:hypothetical protein